MEVTAGNQSYPGCFGSYGIYGFGLTAWRCLWGIHLGIFPSIKALVGERIALMAPILVST